MRLYFPFYCLLLIALLGCTTQQDKKQFADASRLQEGNESLVGDCMREIGKKDIQRRIQFQECLYDTDGSITSLFHSTLYYPQEIGLRFDGFIVGLEKSPRERITENGKVPVHPIADAGLANAADSAKKINDGKLLFVSHILRNAAVPGAISNCALYNAYDVTVGTVTKRQLVDYCGGTEILRVKPEEAFENSWKALDKLKSSISGAVESGKYTHVLIVTMGWNTEQVEAVRNINSIAGNFVNASKVKANPLVIGVTWPSMWISKWVDPVIKVASFPSKAEDADEVGLTWLGVLLHDTVPAALSGSPIPVIAIGHSFGGRATIAAACVGPIISPSTTALPRGHIDTAIIFQGAFMSEQLFASTPEKFHYPLGCPNVGKLALTSSVADKANNIPFWGTYSGDDRTFKKHCAMSENAGRVSCASAGADGELSTVKAGEFENIMFINANSLINEHAYGTGGGAHSDIFRREHGTLINAVLQRDTGTGK